MVSCHGFRCLWVSTRGRQCVYYSSGNFFTKYHISWWDYLQNTLWVFLGNAVGGSLFMAVPLIFMTKPATVKPRVEKTIQTEELYGN